MMSDSHGDISYALIKVGKVVGHDSEVGCNAVFRRVRRYKAAFIHGWATLELGADGVRGSADMALNLAHICDANPSHAAQERVLP